MFCIAGAALMGLPGCNDEDPNYDNVALPEIDLPPHMLTGMISGVDGSMLAGATVKMGNDVAMTDAQGLYVFDNVRPGTYDLQVASEGRLPVDGQVVVNDSKLSRTQVWNAMLAKDIKQNVVISQTEDQTVSLEVEMLKGNPKTLIKIDALVPAKTISSADKATLTFAPAYNKGQFETAGTTSQMLIGTKISTDAKVAKFDKAVVLQYNLAEELAEIVQTKKLVDGRWVKVENSREGRVITLQADEATSYGLFFDVTIAAESSKEPVEFAQSTIDNLYGSKPMHIESVGYTFKMGAEIINQGESEKSALVVEMLKSFLGAAEAVSVSKEYPIDVVLNVGNKLELEGTQNVKVLTVTVGNISIQVRKYGAVSIKPVVTNREHSGGSN